MEGRERAYIGLGANVGPARETLGRAIAALAALPGASLQGVSRLYRTRPVGPVAQEHFLNAAAALDVPAGGDPAQAAMALLDRLKDIERALGRQERQRYGPREIDLDLLLFGAHRLRVGRLSAVPTEHAGHLPTAWLEVPHPAASQRLFVLAPLADLAPAVVPPGWSSTVRQARDEALRREGPDAVRPLARWDGDLRAWREQPSGHRGRLPPAP